MDVVALKEIVHRLIVEIVHMVEVEARALVVEARAVVAEEAREVQVLAGEVEDKAEVVIVHTMGMGMEETVEDSVAVIEAVEEEKVEDVVEEEDAVAVIEATAVVKVSLVHLNEDLKPGATQKVATNIQASKLSMNDVNAQYFLWLERNISCG